MARLALNPDDDDGDAGATPAGAQPGTPETPALSPKTPEDRGPRASAARPRGRIVRAPRWSRFAHYGLHALLGLLILILLIALILIELDAKDGGDDGLPNRILRPFSLQLDGAASGGAAACERAAPNGFVQAGLLYHQIVEDLDRSLDEADALFASDAVFFGPRGTVEGWAEHKRVIETAVRPRWALERDGEETALEAAGFALTPTEVVVQVQARTKKGGRVLHAYFAVAEFDPGTGLMVRHTVYPSLSFVLERVDAAKTLLNAFDAGRDADDRDFERAIAALDDVLDENFVRITDQSLSVQSREEFKRQIRSYRENRDPNAPEIEVDREYYATGDFVSDRCVPVGVTRACASLGAAADGSHPAALRTEGGTSISRARASTAERRAAWRFVRVTRSSRCEPPSRSHSLTHARTHSLTHSLTRLLAHSHTHSSTRRGARSSRCSPSRRTSSRSAGRTPSSFTRC